MQLKCCEGASSHASRPAVPAPSDLGREDDAVEAGLVAVEHDEARRARERRALAEQPGQVQEHRGGHGKLRRLRLEELRQAHLDAARSKTPSNYPRHASKTVHTLSATKTPQELRTP